MIALLKEINLENLTEYCIKSTEGSRKVEHWLHSHWSDSEAQRPAAPPMARHVSEYSSLASSPRHYCHIGNYLMALCSSITHLCNTISFA